MDNVCVWTKESSFDIEYYETECEHSFVFTCDDILENGFKYCPFCGRAIKTGNLATITAAAQRARAAWDAIPEDAAGWLATV